MHHDKEFVTLTIDGRKTTVKAGTTLLAAATDLGIHIPTLCHLKELAPDGSCRLCVVEVEGGRKGGLPAACTEECADGMVIHTKSERVAEARRFVLDLLLSNHTTNCFSCPANSSCRLQEYAFEYGIEQTTYLRGKRQPLGVVDDSNPFFTYKPELCIMCRRCTRTCQNLQGRDVISVANRGFDTAIRPGGDRLWVDSNCESCGNCVQACPTGALSSKDNSKNYRAYEVEKTTTTCPHCAVGCQLNLLTKRGKLVGAEGADGPSNGGQLCVKGRFGSFKFVDAGDRLRTPLIRENGEFREAGWDEALELVANRMGAIKQQHGPEAIAGFSCSRAPNEDNYLFQKMMRAAFGTNNVDNCARV